MSGSFGAKMLEKELRAIVPHGESSIVCLLLATNICGCVGVQCCVVLWSFAVLCAVVCVCVVLGGDFSLAPFRRNAGAGVLGTGQLGRRCLSNRSGERKVPQPSLPPGGFSKWWRLAFKGKPTVLGDHSFEKLQCE